MGLRDWYSPRTVDALRRPANASTVDAQPTPIRRRAATPTPIAGVLAYVERAYVAWCATRAIQPKALPDLERVGEHQPGDGSDARRSSLNRDYVLIGDRWTHAPLSRSVGDVAPEPGEFRLTEQEHEWLKSDDAKQVAANARAWQELRDGLADDEALCGQVDRLLANDRIAQANLSYMENAPTSAVHAAEQAHVNAKWDEIDAARRDDEQGQVAA